MLLLLISNDNAIFFKTLLVKKTGLCEKRHMKDTLPDSTARRLHPPEAL
jgi:hypothetical protein